MVFPAKYRRAVFDEAVDKVVRDVCLGIEKRYQIKFLEIGIDKDHVHFLILLFHCSIRILDIDIKIEKLCVDSSAF